MQVAWKNIGADSRSLDFNRDVIGQTIAGLFGLLLGVHWLASYSYSLGYDLPLWVYNGWFLKNALFEGSIPNWSFLAASGQPFFKISGLSDGVLVAVAMRIFGDYFGVQVVMCALYVIAAVGFFTLARVFIGCRHSAMAACGAYVLSWFMTFTANFQAYISNFFVYALLPWFVLFALQALLYFSLRPVCWAAIILALSILANPQVAIKAVVIGAIVTVPFVPSVGLRKTALAAGGVLLLALALSAFDIISAVRLRQEVMTINSRQNGYISPFALVAIPAYGFSLLWEMLASVRWPTITLHELLYSKYPGMSVLALALLSLRRVHSSRAVVRWLMVVVFVSYCVFFAIMPHIPAAPWIGISHNLIIVPTFCLALLAGLGLSSLRHWLLGRWGQRGVFSFSVGVLGVGFVELYALFFGVRTYGSVRDTPINLPEANVWTELAQLVETEPFAPRFLSLNPDHSTSLFPVVTGLPTANVVDLRQRLPEYQSYLDLVEHCGLSGTCQTPMSALLAPLNVGYVDVPLKFFRYKGPVAQPGEYREFQEGLTTFERDPLMERVLTRTIDTADLRPHATSVEWSPFIQHKKIVTDGLPAQAIFRNTVRSSAYVADRAFAIVGEGLAPENLFEQIVLLPEYEPGRFVFILTESLESLGPRQREALDGYLVVERADQSGPDGQISVDGVRSHYMEPSRMWPEIAFSSAKSEELRINLSGPVQSDRYIFVSQQFFRDWRAKDDMGNRVDVFKAGGGLVSLFLYEGSTLINAGYRLPPVEYMGRLFSALTWLGVFCALYFSRYKKVSLSALMHLFSSIWLPSYKNRLFGK